MDAQGLVAGELRIEVEDDGAGGPVRAVWLGKSTDREPGTMLDPFLTTLTSAARTRGVALEMHFEQLELFNSSTLTSIIQLIQEARERETRIVIVYNPAVKWQKLSFDAMRVFALGDGLFELRPV